MYTPPTKHVPLPFEERTRQSLEPTEVLNKLRNRVDDFMQSLHEPIEALSQFLFNAHTSCDRALACISTHERTSLQGRQLKEVIQSERSQVLERQQLFSNPLQPRDTLGKVRACAQAALAPLLASNKQVDCSTEFFNLEILIDSELNRYEALLRQSQLVVEQRTGHSVRMALCRYLNPLPEPQEVPDADWSSGDESSFRSSHPNIPHFHLEQHPDSLEATAPPPTARGQTSSAQLSRSGTPFTQTSREFVGPSSSPRSRSVIPFTQPSREFVGRSSSPDTPQEDSSDC